MKIYAYLDGKLAQIRMAMSPDNYYGTPPPDSSLQLIFDEDTNVELVNDINYFVDTYTCISGILYKNGTPVSINPPTEQHQNENLAFLGYDNLSAWVKAGTADQAETYLTTEIFDGLSQTEINTWIDDNITDVTVANLSQVNLRLASIRQGLKLLAGAIVSMRGFFVITTKLLIYIRDLVIRFKKET